MDSLLLSAAARQVTRVASGFQAGPIPTLARASFQRGRCSYPSTLAQTGSRFLLLMLFTDKLALWAWRLI